MKKLHFLILFVTTTFTFLVSVAVIPHISVSTRLEDGLPAMELDQFKYRYYQFNVDSADWIEQVQHFPDNIDEGISRLNRPLYLTLSSFLSRAVTTLINIPDLGQGLTVEMDHTIIFASMIFINYISIIILVLVYFIWLNNYFEVRISFVASLMLSLSRVILGNAMVPTPDILGLLISVLMIVVYDIYLRRVENPSWTRIFLVALFFGFLFLVKAHYHILIAICLWSLYLRRWRLVFGIGIVHFIPLLLWIVILRINNIEYYNQETHIYRQVVWVWDYLSTGQILQIYPNIMVYTGNALQRIVYVFTPQTLFLAMWAYATPQSFNKQGRYGFILYSVSLITFFVLIKRAPNYLVFDFYIFIFPLVAMSLIRFSEYLNGLPHSIISRVRLSFIVSIYIILETLIGWYYVKYPDVTVWLF